MKRINASLSCILLVLLCGGGFAASKTASLQPNIVFIICDDLGYGDVQCLNPEHGKIPTPSADTLADQGIIFTDAHSGSSVCTPTRYGLLTGRYSWRTWLQRGVVKGFEANLIAEDRPTVAGFLKEQGYHTAMIGKWHLNFNYADPESGDLLKLNDYKDGAPVGAQIPDGPVTRGFDTYHGFHHSRHMNVVIEDDTVIEHDDPVNMLPRLTRKAVETIDQYAAKNSDKPFFLYLPLNSPHTPIVPAPEWQGKSGLGDYGDFVMQTDAALGAVM
ncbi:MAG TPA: sulfatase-like hydrolase/transferase, partial [Tichowtungia sp.]|nr:sulfatase-like hydrolase/transferase [Tichowtungia sp.]